MRRDLKTAMPFSQAVDQRVQRKTHTNHHLSPRCDSHKLTCKKWNCQLIKQLITSMPFLCDTQTCLCWWLRLLRLAASVSLYVPVDDGAMHTFLELGILLLICPIKLSLANKFINIKWMVVRVALCLHCMPCRLVLRRVVVDSWCSL